MQMLLKDTEIGTRQNESCLVTVSALVFHVPHLTYFSQPPVKVIIIISSYKQATREFNLPKNPQLKRMT